MNNKEYSILILGNFVSVYIVQFVKNLKKVNPTAHIFFWGYTQDMDTLGEDYLSCYDEYYLFDINHKAGSSVFEKVTAAIQLNHHFKKFASDRHFDYISIQYVRPEFFFVLHDLKKHSSKLVLTPWGSDVYRINKHFKKLAQKIYDAADYVTGPDDRFTRDFIRIFNIPQQKIVHVDLGVDPIEYIIGHKDQIDANEAKLQLGIKDKYAITCGYNASEGHRHIDIIETVNKIRKELPQNLVLLFPLTYPVNPDYIKEIKQKVDEYGLKALYFEKYLDVPHLFLLRQATDLFIHIQPTDASSGTLYEYILCEKKILNGGWLQYPEIEQYGAKPYYLVDDLDALGEAIVNAVNSEPIHIDKHVLRDLAKKQWKVVIKDWDKFFLANRNHE